jgi:Cu-Zn family superoxide dismutase
MRERILKTITFTVGLMVYCSGTLPAQAEPRQAFAKIAGCTDPGVTGMALLSEQPSKEGVRVVDVSLFVKGLLEGRHAVHIHETANCEPCSAANGHFDPGPNGNSSPDDNHPFHLGDLVNIKVDQDGQGLLDMSTTRITLGPGPLRVFNDDGSAIIIHVDPDTYCPEGPVPGCAGGARVACGIIIEPHK